MLRDLKSEVLNQMIVVPGIITSASKAQIKASKMVYRCKNCGHITARDVNGGLGGAMVPRACERQSQEQCPLDPYIVVPEECAYKDHQVLKIQEAPELVPTGEMPRTFIVTCERGLVDKVTPGMRITLVGIFSILSRGGDPAGGDQVQVSYIRALGIQKEGGENSMGFHYPNLTPHEEDQIREMSRDPEIYEKIAKSIGGSIYGQEDVKKATACLLFSGTGKKLPDGMKLRGEINILLLGDPSTAKSQMLKFVDRLAPVSIYTSGKGSSAAGLTAAVIRDHATGEF